MSRTHVTTEEIYSPIMSDLLKNKSQPEAAASGAAEWVITEREMRERLQREKEAKELKEKLEVSFCPSHHPFSIS